MAKQNDLISGRYRLEQLLGRGAFAEVWRGHDQRLDRPIAIKLLDEKLVEIEGDGIVEQFQLEVKAVARLNHPHIVKIDDTGMVGRQLFLVMEYLEGGELSKRLTGAAWSLRQTLDLLEPLAHALAVSHAKGMIHRDIKPQNILFRRDGLGNEQVVLADFGLVKVISGSLYASNPQFSQGRLIGTPEYMSPEQAESEPVDARTDLYALAILAYQLLVGRVPFKGNTALSTLRLANDPSREKIKPILREKLPSTVAEWLLAGMAVDPQQRPATPLDFVQRGRKIERQPRWKKTKGGIPIIAQWSELQQGDYPLPERIIWEKDDKEMVLIPGGAFTLGLSKAEAEAISKQWGGALDYFLRGTPAQQIILPPYYIDLTPVTQAEYARFLADNPQQAVPSGTLPLSKPHTWDSRTRKPRSGMEQHPVVLVNWHTATRYAIWAGKQLPTEAQWEKAARGSDGRAYPWGDQWDRSRLNSAETHAQRELLSYAELNKWLVMVKDTDQLFTTPVGTFPRGNSPYGVIDMAGNVWEWTQTKFVQYPYQEDDGRNEQNGTDHRVMRGGSWYNHRFYARSSDRNGNVPGYINNCVGFRCASTVF